MFKKFNEVIRDLIFFALELTIGIFFLIMPKEMTMGLIILLGIISIILGLKDIYTYITEKAEEAASGTDLVTGIAFVLIGLLCTIGHNGVFAAVNQWVVYLFGAVMILFGLNKVQHTIDKARLHKKYWWVDLMLAVIKLALGAVILINPFKSGDSSNLFIGISFIVVSALTLAGAVFILRMTELDRQKAQEDVQMMIDDVKPDEDPEPEPEPSDPTAESSTALRKTNK